MRIYLFCFWGFLLPPSPPPLFVHSSASGLLRPLRRLHTCLPFAISPSRGATTAAFRPPGRGSPGFAPTAPPDRLGGELVARAIAPPLFFLVGTDFRGGLVLAAFVWPRVPGVRIFGLLFRARSVRAVGVLLASVLMRPHARDRRPGSFTCRGRRPSVSASAPAASGISCGDGSPSRRPP